MATLRVPVTGGLVPYRITVELDGVFWPMLFRWNARDNHWYMDFGDVLLGSKLVHGDDLLSQFAHMQVDGRIPPGTFRVFDIDGLERDPDPDTLGSTVFLLYDEA